MPLTLTRNSTQLETKDTENGMKKEVQHEHYPLEIQPYIHNLEMVKANHMNKLKRLQQQGLI
jgi:hypothetical protein